MRELTIVPRAGLANRMRVIASGVHIAKAINAFGRIYWLRKNECNADFEHLFMPINIDNILMNSVKSSYFFISPPSIQNLFLPYFIRKFTFKKEINDFNKKDGNIIDLFPNNGKIYISSCHSMDKHHPLKEVFIPTLEIQQKIEKVKEQFSSNVIGFHIRRTDHLLAIEKNSIEEFKTKIKAELSDNPETKIYLATDSIETKNEIKEEFGKSIITYEASLRRNTIEGMKDAVVDLWCLSSCKYIIGSYYSSYSELAAELGNIKLKILPEIV